MQPASRRTNSALRDSFLDFFRKNGHRVVPSTSLLPPENDDSVLFVNAGMTPFKTKFLEADNCNSSERRIASAQRCIRAGGKHNDLDQVGFTSRHQTYFEMLGNFSFGDYFKEEAIYYAWSFLTDRQNIGLPIDRLLVTVLEGDHESERLWKRIAGLKDDRILKLGKTDNFWSMADTGPCGPCSEIFFDQDPQGSIGLSTDQRWLELWNLVFMQHNRGLDQSLQPLPNLSIDTGMGLERLASVVQNVPSNYHTDSLAKLVDSAAEVVAECGGIHIPLNRYAFNLQLGSASAYELEVAQLKDSDVCALRVIADHTRAATMLLIDSVYPSNTGRGYVLRRIIRRAVRYGTKLGVKGPFLNKMVPIVISGLPKEAALNADIESIQTVILSEENSFLGAISRGMNEFENVLLKSSVGNVNAADAFRLHDTYGLPIDIVCDVVSERFPEGRVDLEGFDILLEQQRARGRAQESISKVATREVFQRNDKPNSKSVFTGYSSLNESKVEILKLEMGDDNCDQFWISINPCPFYPNGGGQVGDKGSIVVTESGSPKKLEFDILDTRQQGDSIKLLAKLKDQSITEEIISFLRDKSISDGVNTTATVNSAHRTGCCVHHTGTHLLNAALESVLGSHVHQAGSLVESTRLRFDFTHSESLSASELKKVESFINNVAKKDLPIDIQEMSIAAAEKTGAKCEFREKYDDNVRVVSIGNTISKELCGGTHVDTSMSIYPFCILSESSIASGVRRIEAVAGASAIENLLNKREELAQIDFSLPRGAVGSTFDKTVKVVERMHEQEKLSKELVERLIASPSTPRISGALGDVDFHVHVVQPIVKFSSKEASNFLRRKSLSVLEHSSSAVHVLVMNNFIAVVSRSASIPANSVLKDICNNDASGTIKGGGSSEYAQGKSKERISFNDVYSCLSKMVL